jgi:CheY-like chemotaxis protein
MELFGRTRPELRVELELTAEGCAVDCDQGQIEQLLLNLFVNAAQAMQGGGVLTVRTRVKEYGPELTEPFGQTPGWFVELAVQDTGVGMDETVQARIFEPFFTTKKLGGGTGLGLASVYGILKNHRGLIRVKSQVGAGSTFTIALGLSKAPVPALAGAGPEEIKRGEDTVLVIDDQEIIRTVTQDMLEMIGCKVFTAASGVEGVALFETRRGQIDLVILDMIMPGMGGAETFRRLRALEPGLPVILASGYSVEGEVARLLAAGCNGFLQKPFNAAQLSGKIREVLRARESA